MSTIFTKIIEGEIPSYKVAENEDNFICDGNCEECEFLNMDCDEDCANCPCLDFCEECVKDVV